MAPSLAVVETLKERQPEADVLFLGANIGPEADLIRSRGHRFEPLPASAFFRVPLRRRPLAMWNALTGARRARRLLRDHGTQLLLGFGGYGSVGAVLAASSLRIPVVLHELNAQPGLTNWVLARLARRVLGSFNPMVLGGRPATCVGTPVESHVLASGEEREPPQPGSLRVLVCGGTAGSRFLDDRVPELLARLARRGIKVQVLHSVGSTPAEGPRAAYARAGIEAHLTPFIEQMAGAYAWADVAVACGGAATLAELASAGLPALLVPLAEAALDHQAANVERFSERTGALWTTEAEWDPESLVSSLETLAVNPAAWLAASDGMRRAHDPRAAANVVAACFETLGANARNVSTFEARRGTEAHP